MVLKRPFISDTEDDSALHIHYSGLQGDRALPSKDSFTQKMVLTRLFIDHTEEDFTHLVFMSPRTEWYRLVCQLQRIDFRQFPLWKGVVILGGLAFDA